MIINVAQVSRVSTGDMEHVINTNIAANVISNAKDHIFCQSGEALNILHNLIVTVYQMRTWQIPTRNWWCFYHMHSTVLNVQSVIRSMKQ